MGGCGREILESSKTKVSEKMLCAVGQQRCVLASSSLSQTQYDAVCAADGASWNETSLTMTCPSAAPICYENQCVSMPYGLFSFTVIITITTMLSSIFLAYKVVSTGGKGGGSLEERWSRFRVCNLVAFCASFLTDLSLLVMQFMPQLPNLIMSYVFVFFFWIAITASVFCTLIRFIRLDKVNASPSILHKVYFAMLLTCNAVAMVMNELLNLAITTPEFAANVIILAFNLFLEMFLNFNMVVSTLKSLSSNGVESTSASNITHSHSGPRREIDVLRQRAIKKLRIKLISLFTILLLIDSSAIFIFFSSWTYFEVFYIGMIETLAINAFSIHIFVSLHLLKLLKSGLDEVKSISRQRAGHVTEVTELSEVHSMTTSNSTSKRFHVQIGGGETMGVS